MKMHNSEESAARWFRVLKKSPRPSIRLICFPHAGGMASFFRPWLPLVPEGVELLAVRYPGREDRLLEPFARTMEDLADSLAAACRGFQDAPLALFGHSMGALVAYEVAVRLQAQGRAGVAALFVSGCAGPGHPRRRRSVPATDADLLDEVRMLGGTADEALADEDLREVLLPAVRADFELVDRCDTSVVKVLNAPVVAYYGDLDSHQDADSIAAWSAATRSSFQAYSFSGGHFYLVDHAKNLVDGIFASLRETAVP